jgi:hexosaminidase
VSVVEREGAYVLTPGLAIDGPPEWATAARRLLTPGTGLDLPGADGAAFVITADPGLPAEGYRLTVDATGIALAAADLAGVNWGVQTLRQLLPASAVGRAPTGDALALPFVEIVDQPRFGWRGMMLDTGRHFCPLSDLYALLDLLALHKYNVFHLHLTEDQGWRFESKRHPELQAAATRSETQNPAWAQGDGTPHGGYYTQDQLRALVAYAAQRGITVVPEVEFPGHVLALLSAFPELGNDPTRTYAAATTWGVFDEVLNLTDAAMAFVYDIFEEILDVFPSPYVHVGGDECPRVEWRASDAAQALAAARGVDVEHLQTWFTAELRDWLAARGRQLVGWDEINDEGVLEGAVTMAWRGPEKGMIAARAGGQVVMSPVTHTYFDYYPGEDQEEPYSIGGLITTEQAYALDPVAELDEAAAARVIGTQCQVWTEYMPTHRRVQYMLFPRSCAHAEVAWSAPDGRDWSEFAGRLAGHLARLDVLGVDYRPETGPRPWQQGGTGAWRRPDAHRADAGGDAG